MNKRTGIMLCYPFEERRLTEKKFGWAFPLWVQPKLDGERCRALIKNGKVLLLSSQENVFTSIPHIENELIELSKNIAPHSIELDGELYSHALNFEEIHSRVSRIKPHENFEQIEYHIFDLVNLDFAQSLRFSLLDNILSKEYKYLKKVGTEMVLSLDELYNKFNYYVNSNYEGIIIRKFNLMYERKRSNEIMKFKPKSFDDYIIKDLYEAIDKNGIEKGILGGMTLFDDDGREFNVGAGYLNHDQRKEYWEKREYLRRKKVRIQYQSKTNKKIPRFGLIYCLVED